MSPFTKRNRPGRGRTITADSLSDPESPGAGTRLRGRQTALERIQEFKDFGEINHAIHEQEIDDLLREKKTLEDGNDAIRVLKQRLEKAKTAEQGLQDARDKVIGQETVWTKQLKDYEQFIANAKKTVKERTANGVFARHSESFSDLEAWFSDRPLTPATLIQQ
jgi:uncharacterized protein YPO0396